VELAALSSVLHSFYNWVERLLRRIARRIDGALPSGESWHAALLASMSSPNSRRPAVISEHTRQLLGYLRFRHFVRTSSTSLLEWEPMADLVSGLERALESLSSDVRRLLDEGDPHIGDLPPASPQ